MADDGRGKLKGVGRQIPGGAACQGQKKWPERRGLLGRVSKARECDRMSRRRREGPCDVVRRLLGRHKGGQEEDKSPWGMQLCSWDDSK